MDLWLFLASDVGSLACEFIDIENTRSSFKNLLLLAVKDAPAFQTVYRRATEARARRSRCVASHQVAPLWRWAWCWLRPLVFAHPPHHVRVTLRAALRQAAPTARGALLIATSRTCRGCGLPCRRYEKRERFIGAPGRTCSQCMRNPLRKRLYHDTIAAIRSDCGVSDYEWRRLGKDVRARVPGWSRGPYLAKLYPYRTIVRCIKRMRVRIAARVE